jgi:hypothetical protein
MLLDSRLVGFDDEDGLIRTDLDYMVKDHYLLNTGGFKKFLGQK